MEWLILIAIIYLFVLFTDKQDNKWQDEPVKKKPIKRTKRTKFSQPKKKQPDSLDYNDYFNPYDWRTVKKRYMKTKKYQDKRKARLKLDNYVCQVCLENNTVQSEPLYVHHKRYDCLGSENIKHHLVSLCRTHHALQHDTYGYDPDTIYEPLIYK